VVALLEAGEGGPLGPILVVMASTGCRVGEALGATWIDVDPQDRTWLIARTTTLNSDGQVVLGHLTKTGDTRTVPLTQHVVHALREHPTMFEPMMRTASAWARSASVPVAAPPPQVGPSPAGLGAWQMRAWLSIIARPSEVASLRSR